MFRKKKTVISDNGVTERMDFFGFAVCTISGMISVAMIIIGVLAVVNM